MPKSERSIGRDPSDEDGTQGALGADQFEGLVREHAVALYRFALSLVRDPQLAEDLVQDALLRAFERRAQFRGGSPRAWLRRILFSRAVDRARSDPRELAVADVEERWRDDEYTVDNHAVVERAETRAELEDALVRLPFDHRAAVLLHDVSGWKAREIAEAMDISLAAAKQRLRRGRMMLVSALARGAERSVAMEGVPLSCWDARSRVSDYIDDALDQDARAALEAHLRRCPTCPPLYASLVGVHAGLGALRDPDSVAPPELGERISRLLAR